VRSFLFWKWNDGRPSAEDGEGYSQTEDAQSADLILLNTCHIREKAAEKVYSELGRIRQMVEAKPQTARPRVGVTGCVAQAEGEEIVRRQPLVDLVVGPQAYHRLPNMLDALAGGSAAQVETEFPAEDKFEALPQRTRKTSPSAFLSVQEGCDKFCAFCVVPYTRGAEFSRPVAQIIAEAKRLVEGGSRELTLLGQNVNAYHGEGPDGTPWSLAKLLYRLAELPGVERLRYTTSHPNDMSEDLISAHAGIDALMPYLHLPVQSGSDRVLKDFRDTLDLIEQVGYAQAFSFKYSPRPGTPASTAEQVPEDVKDARLAELQALLRAQQTKFQESCVGRRMDILFEKPGREPGQLIGRSPYLQPVHALAAPELIGQIASVEIEAAHPNSLAGCLL